MRYCSGRAVGLLVGSGPIEGGINYVMQSRMKRIGMRWSVCGASKNPCPEDALGFHHLGEPPGRGFRRGPAALITSHAPPVMSGNSSSCLKQPRGSRSSASRRGTVRAGHRHPSRSAVLVPLSRIVVVHRPTTGLTTMGQAKSRRAQPLARYRARSCRCWWRDNLVRFP